MPVQLWALRRPRLLVCCSVVIALAGHWCVGKQRMKRWRVERFSPPEVQSAARLKCKSRDKDIIIVAAVRKTHDKRHRARRSPHLSYQRHTHTQSHHPTPRRRRQLVPPPCHRRSREAPSMQRVPRPPAVQGGRHTPRSRRPQPQPQQTSCQRPQLRTAVESGPLHQHAGTSPPQTRPAVRTRGLRRECDNQHTSMSVDSQHRTVHEHMCHSRRTHHAHRHRCHC